jgi:ABC-type multidrug transport system ATPase subunit
VAPTSAPVLRQVTKKYTRNGPPVLDRVDLHLPEGFHTVVLGTNGSGKSTLLATVAGVTRPTAGEVSTPRPVSFVPERLPATLRFTGFEYVVQMGQIRGLRKKEAQLKAKDLLARLALAPGPDVPFESLSKGNRQKVMLAQAFIVEASTIVIDEPTSGLDMRATTVVAEFIEEAKSVGSAIMTSAQSIPSWTASDELLRISDGHLTTVTDELRTIPGQYLVEIELTAPPGLEAPGALPSLTGVVAVEAVGARLVKLKVESRVVDQVLIELLGKGWSVQRLSPEGRR